MRSPTVIALLLLGARPEPFLPAVLRCLEGCVDDLIVHDNSGVAQSQNRTVLERSSLYVSGRVGICEAPFVSFSQARNECLEHARRHRRVNSGTWLLAIDADEVHGADLAFITRRLLPSLPAGVDAVDAYYYNFMLSFGLYNALNRRHNLLVRHNDALHWTHNVHEQLRGVEGRRLCLPYTFHHYGYVRATTDIVEKWKLYHDLGDCTRSDRVLEALSAEAVFNGEVDHVIPYRGQYPEALTLLGDTRRLVDPALDRFLALVEARQRRLSARLQTGARVANYRLRLLWRATQCLMEFPRLPDAGRLLRMTGGGRCQADVTPQHAI